MNVIIVPEFELPAVFTPAVGEGIHIAAKKQILVQHLQALKGSTESDSVKQNIANDITYLATDQKLAEVTGGRIVYDTVSVLGTIFRDETMNDKTRIAAITAMVNIAEKDEFTNGDIVSFTLEHMFPEDVETPVADMPGFVDGYISLADRAIEAAALHLMSSARTVRHVKYDAIKDTPVWKVPSDVRYVDKRVKAVDCWKANAYDYKGVVAMHDRATGYLQQFKKSLPKDITANMPDDMFAGPKDSQQRLLQNGYDMYLAFVTADNKRFRSHRDMEALSLAAGLRVA